MCVFAESVFIVCPEAGMTEKLSKLELRGPQGFQVRNRYINISSEGGIIKLSTKGRSSWVVLLFVIKTNSFRGGWGSFNLRFVGSGYCGSVSLLPGSW